MTAGVKHVPNDVSNIENELGKLFVTNTEPSFSIAQGKGLTEGYQGEYCTFTIVTRDSRGQTTYSEMDHVYVEIQSPDTRRVAKPNITDSKDGRYEVKYKLEGAGEFNVSITVRDEAIVGSPFLLKVKKRLPKSRERDVIGGLGQLQEYISKNPRLSVLAFFIFHISFLHLFLVFVVQICKPLEQKNSLHQQPIVHWLAY